MSENNAQDSTAMGSAALSAPATPEAPSSPEEHSANTPVRKFTSVKSVGVAHDRNARFRRTMEDEHVILDNYGSRPDQGYFAVYDGHGGRAAVDFTAKNLHHVLLEELQNEGQTTLEAIRQAYLKTDKQMAQIQFSGTTSVSALIRVDPATGKRMLYAANAGDARAVIARNRQGVRLTYDHKGTDAGETKRIVDAGGFVVLNRVNGMLAVTRSLGDSAMKDFVIGDPHLSEIELESTDSHLVLACDGLWDVASDQEVVDLIVDEQDTQKASEKLLIHALRSGSTDNISVMVVAL